MVKSLVMAVTLWMTLFPGWLAVGSWSDTDSDSLNDTWTDPQSQVATTLADMNLVNNDADNDGATNAEEAAAGSDPYKYDTDYDEIRDGDELHITMTNPLSWDTDGDEVSDYDESRGFSGVTYPGGAMPGFSGATYADYDGDGIKNPDDPLATDPDNYSAVNGITWYSNLFGNADGDSFPNWQDPFPLDQTNYSDYNRINWYGDALADADGDGTPNWQDTQPYPDVQDTDGDLLPDGTDPFPSDANNYSAVNGTAWYGSVLGDADGDGLVNWQDPYPNDATNTSSVNGIAWNGNVLEDGDGDGVVNWQDPYPNDATNTSSVNGIAWSTNLFGDLDGDGTVNWQDPTPLLPADADMDGIPDSVDPFPADLTNYSALNGTRWYAEVNLDADSDSIANWRDPWTEDPANPSSINGTQWFADVWMDGDGDSAPNWWDPYPYDAVNTSSINGVSWYAEVIADSDGDGIQNWEDTIPYGNDGDGDGLTHGEEIQCGTSDEDVDCDDDGLTDYEEVMAYQTDPLNANHLSQLLGWGDLYADFYLVNQEDADSDGIPTRIEVLYGLNPNEEADAAGDLDGNGVDNLTQYQTGLALNADLAAYDADGDGMTDVFEDHFDLDKNNPLDATADPDSDGVTNYEESKIITSPRLADTRATGGLGDLQLLMEQVIYGTGNAPSAVDANANNIPDWADAALGGSNPFFNRPAANDIDGDGLPNHWEHKHGLWKYPANGLQMRYADATSDPDDDGVLNLYEYRLGTHPLIQDTDSDGKLDGVLDSDGDGLIDLIEAQDGTDPHNQDTDGDGWYDDEERRMQGGNALDDEVKPTLLPSEAYVEVQTRWIKASWKADGGPVGFLAWVWSWNSEDPPSGSWGSFGSNPGEFPREELGSATFSDYREPLAPTSLQAARDALGQLGSMQDGWSSGSGAYSVSSSCTETPVGGAPPAPDWTPTYPDYGYQESTWSLMPTENWNGGVMEVRLRWSDKAPNKERLSAVSKSFVKVSKENGTVQAQEVKGLTIQPEEEASAVTVQLHADATSNGVTIVENLLPVEVIRKNDNSAYDPNSEALGVSNYVTTDGLPQDSQFNDTCADPENFRLQARVLNPQTNSVQMKLEVIRGGSSVVTHNYTLDKKDGDFVRGRFLRLVSDTNDDAASVAGANADPNNQTILVRLGDTIKVSYDIAPGSKVEQKIQVGRPSSENNNEAGKPWKHDIREVKCRFVVFGNAATAAQIDQEIDTLNERYAQCGVKMKVVGKKLGVALPAEFATGGFTRGGSPIQIANADERELLNHLDADNNTVDFMYVPDLNDGLGNAVRATAYRAGRNATGNARFQNFVVVGPTRGELSVGHELMHVLLNISHRMSAGGAWLDATTALFHGTTTKAVDGTKRIGPYPAAAAGVGNDDTTTIRNNAEQLP